LIVEKNGFQNNLYEGFQEGMITNGLISGPMPHYSSSNNVWTLYDNIHFDDKNGNLIEVSGMISNVNDDTGGNTITNNSVTTIVTDRTGETSTNYVTTKDVSETLYLSQLNNLISQYKSWLYNTQTNNSEYTVFYMPWNTDTYIHVVDNIKKIQLGTFLFSSNIQPKSIYFTTPMLIGLTHYVDDNDKANNTMVIEPIYSPDKQLYQLSHYVKFDITNGNLIIINGDDESTKSLTIYDSNKNMNIITSCNKTANNFSLNTRPNSNTNFSPYTVLDTLGQKSILYIPNNENVLIAIISYSDNSLSTYSLLNVCRFNKYGLDTGNQLASATNIQNTTNNTSMCNNPMSNYYNSCLNLPTTSGSNRTSCNSNMPVNMNDYILKTQIVPPVCPTCPTCPSIGTCSNCGGTGGSGTLTHNGNSIVRDVPNIKSDTIGGSLTKVTHDTVTGIQDVAKTGAGVITGVAGNISGVANNLISTTGSILKPNQTASNNNIGYNENKSRQDVPNQRSTPGYTPPGLSANNQHNDPYSYYGQLPAKGKTNYVPITADFSNFAR
jgi:hypothetical protein